MFINNNHVWLHLWWKGNLLNHQKVSKYFKYDCLQNFILLFMSLLTVWIVKSNSLAGICFIFLKDVLDYTWKAFNTKFRPQWKDRESSYQVRPILAPFCKLVSLILGYNCFKGLRLTKIVKQIRSEGVLGQFRNKKLFPETIIHKMFETVFM